MKAGRIFLNLLLASSIALVASGCARRISKDVYHSGHVGEASSTYKGVIISVRNVTVQEAERLQENSAGIGLGAVAGGVAGSALGKGHGQLAAMAGGAILGGLAGALIQDQLGTQEGIEYTVQLDNGSLKTVVQGPDEGAMRVGQRVLVIVSNPSIIGDQNRSRVVPDNSPVQAAPQPHYAPASYPMASPYPVAAPNPYPQAQYPAAYPQPQYPAAYPQASYGY